MVYGHGAALKAVNGNITNNRGGNLNIYTDGKAFTYGIYADGTVSNSVNNQASIMIGQLGGYAQAAEGTASSYGIWTDNAKIINSGDVSLGNSSGSLTDIYGLYASANGSIENSGVINLYNAGTAIYTQNGTVRNLSTSGIINIVTDGSKDSYGIRTTLTNNNEINNQNRISITAKGSAYSSSHKNTGIYGNKVRNSGNIQIGSTLTSMSGAYGIFCQQRCQQRQSAAVRQRQYRHLLRKYRCRHQQRRRRLCHLFRRCLRHSRRQRESGQPRRNHHEFFLQLRHPCQDN